MKSLNRFETLWKTKKNKEEFCNALKNEFLLFKSSGVNNRVLFTGYYEPLVEVDTVRSEVYRYPLYRTPDDMLNIDLKLFQIECNQSRLIGRLQKDRVVPYYTRSEIDRKGALSQRKLEIAWARNAVDVFFLHIQGSGILRFPSGKYIRVRYDGQNGHPYRSIGKILIDRGKIPQDRMSMPAIRSYLKQHPEELEEILDNNRSYIFFRPSLGAPHGNIGVPLTPGRSIATDYRIFPKGALSFITCRKPELNWRGKIVGWNNFSRFVLNQDTGGAIRGPGRVDIYWGAGNFARAAAGYSKEQGHLYFLVLKKQPSSTK